MTTPQSTGARHAAGLGWGWGMGRAQCNPAEVMREQLGVRVACRGSLILVFSQLLYVLAPALLFTDRSLLLVFSQLLYAVLGTNLQLPGAERFLWSPIFNGVLAALVFGASFTTWFGRHWRAFSFGFCSAILASLTWATTLAGQHEILFGGHLLFITGTAGLVPWHPGEDMVLGAAILFIVGTAGLVPWEDPWQVAFNLIALGLWGAGAHAMGTSGPLLWFRGLAMLAAVALAQMIAALRNYQRRREGARLVALGESERALKEEAERRAAVIARLERTEKQLRQSEEKLRKVFEASPDVIAINSLVDGRCIEVNSAFEKTGYRKDESVKFAAGEHGPITDQKQLDRFVARLKQSGHVRNMEMDFRRKDGVVQRCLVSAAMVELDGEPCAVTVARDISQLERAEHELVEAREAALAASRAKSDFLSSMSHEIRTPMNAILGMAELLSETPLNAQQRRFVSAMINNGDTLLLLVNHILDLAKVESGRLVLDKAEFDLGELCDGVGEGLAVPAHQKGIELAVRIAPDVPLNVIGDALRLRQILMNLVGNAVKFTDHGGVALAVEREARTGEAAPLHFTVSDTGIGIAHSQREEIFSSFSQVHASTARKYGGTGLGLAIARRLVELMGGRIWVESMPGCGSTFHFAIPLERSHSARKELPTVPPRVDLTGVRTLVVDDIAINRLIVRETLSAVGARVREAESGLRALARLARARLSGQRYDLLIADCRMPEMDGFELVRRIRAQSGCPVPVILMLTSDDLNLTLARAREEGIEAYLVKPIRRAELLSAVATAMNGRNSKERNAAFLSPQSEAAGTSPLEFRVLLAEDSPDNQLLVEGYLEKTPFRLECAENGEAALAKFKSTGYDAVLMDIHMPIMDGYQALRAIRQWEWENHRKTTPVIALTASALSDDVAKSLSAGFDMHVSKPMKRATLLDAIRSAIEKSRARAASQPEKVEVQVEVEEHLADLAADFIARKRRDAQAILDALGRGDHEMVGNLGHRLKGEGGSFGMDAVTQIGAALEQAAKERDVQGARRLAQELLNYLEKVAPVSPRGNDGQTGERPG